MEVLARVDFYSGVNTIRFKQWIITYSTDKVSHGLRLNACKVIYNVQQLPIKNLVYFSKYRN